MRIIITIVLVVMTISIPCNAQSVSENDPEHKVLGRPANSVGDIGDKSKVKNFRLPITKAKPENHLSTRSNQGPTKYQYGYGYPPNVEVTRYAVGDFGVEKQKWWLRKIQAEKLRKSIAVPQDKSFKDGKTLRGYDSKLFYKSQ